MMPSVRACATCGSDFTPQRGNPGVYCTKACHGVAQRTIAGVGDRDCAQCGTPFTSPIVKARYCSRHCNAAYWKRRGPSYLAHKRKPLTQPHRLRLFERDGWMCYLCQKSIDAHLKAPHPLSPTVDHVKPYALGGETTDDNLRAAHWQCNVDKGDQLPPWWVVAA